MDRVVPLSFVKFRLDGRAGRVHFPVHDGEGHGASHRVDHGPWGGRGSVCNRGGAKGVGSCIRLVWIYHGGGRGPGTRTTCHGAFCCVKRTLASQAGSVAVDGRRRHAGSEGQIGGGVDPLRRRRCLTRLVSLGGVASGTGGGGLGSCGGTAGVGFGGRHLAVVGEQGGSGSRGRELANPGLGRLRGPAERGSDTGGSGVVSQSGRGKTGEVSGICVLESP